MSKVFIAVGHGGTDVGAVGNGLKEAELNLRQAIALKRLLVRHGVVVELSREKEVDNPVAVETQQANKSKADLSVALHTNAGGGSGFELFYNHKMTLSKNLGLCIEAEVRGAGLKSRGAKYREGTGGTVYYKYLRECVMPSVITEMAFIDNKDDISKFDEDHEIEKYCTCLAKGILAYLGIKWVEPVGTSDCWFRVICGSFRKRENAAELQAALKEKGFSSFIEIK